MPLATFENVSLAYGHVPLLDHVDLVVEAGSRIGLIGPNGAGQLLASYRCSIPELLPFTPPFVMEV